MSDQSLHRRILRQAFVVLLLVLIVLPISEVSAHDGPHDGGAAGWHWDWRVLVSLGLVGGFYGRGLFEVWRRAGFDHGIPIHQAASFFMGLVMLLIALVSPIDALGETQFSMHMIQHLILMIIAAPLIAYGLTKAALAFSLPRSIRMQVVSRQPWRNGIEKTGRALTQPALVWALHAAAVILWHLPLLYQAAINSETIHILQHLSFFFTGLLFWWILFFGRLGFITGGLYIFTTATYNGLIGALLTLSNGLAYPIYADRVNLWGLTALEDQQLAGLIMWVPPSIVYLAALLYIVYAGVRSNDSGQPTMVSAASAIQPYDERRVSEKRRG